MLRLKLFSLSWYQYLKFELTTIKFANVSENTLVIAIFFLNLQYGSKVIHALVCYIVTSKLISLAT